MSTITSLARLTNVKSGSLSFFACLLLSGSAHATTFNAVNDFSLAGNPSGVWSYRSGGALLTTPVFGSGSQAGLNYWWSGQPVPNSIGVFKNVTASPVQYLSIVFPTNYLGLDGESESADVRFTAATTANYTISGSFLGIDRSERSHPVEILDNGSIIFNGTIASYAQSDPFSQTKLLHAGDTLDFQSLTGSTFTNLSTGLAVTISSATPEPASLGIAAIGLIAVSLLTRKKLTRRLRSTKLCQL